MEESSTNNCFLDTTTLKEYMCVYIYIDIYVYVEWTFNEDIINTTLEASSRVKATR